MQHKSKALLIAGATALFLVAGSAIAIPLNWTKTFYLTGVEENLPGSHPGEDSNVPTYPPAGQGTVFAYGRADLDTPNPKNRTTTVTLKDAGPELPDTNMNGDPVRYEVTEIVFMGDSRSLISEAVGYATNHLEDILAVIRFNGAEFDTTNFIPFAGVGAAGYLCFGGSTILYENAHFGDPNNPDADDGTWDGICPSDGTGSAPGQPQPPAGTTGPYLTSPNYPHVNDFITTLVNDDTTFDIIFSDANLQSGSAESPDYVLRNLTVEFRGRCVTNCTGGGVTPAPATLALFGLGLAGLGAIRRRSAAG